MCLFFRSGNAQSRDWNGDCGRRVVRDANLENGKSHAAGYLVLRLQCSRVGRKIVIKTDMELEIEEIETETETKIRVENVLGH